MSSTRIRSAIFVLAAAIALAGCSSTPAPEPSTAPESSETAAVPVTFDLVSAALPTEQELAAEYSSVTVCSSSAGECGDGSIPSFAQAIGQQRIAGGDETFGGVAAFIVDGFADAAAATTSYEQMKAADAPYGASFDFPVQEQDGGYAPGTTGTGTLTDFATGDWTGYRLDRTIAFVHPDHTTSPTDDSKIVVTNGTVLVSVTVIAATPGGSTAAAELDAKLAALLAKIA
jgi:hypothetical protein